MQRWAKLNDRQLTVLRRISAGEKPVNAKTPALATTVYALRDRGLVATPRIDGIWQAELTDTGRFYLEHGYHPDHPDRPGSPSAVPPPRKAGELERGCARRGSESLAEDLIKRLQSNGGTLQVENPDEETRASCRRAIHAAKQHGLVPAGLRLRHTGRNSGDLIIKLFDAAHPDETDWNRIRLGVRDKVTDADALVEMLNTHPEVLDVSDAQRPRATKLVRALAAEARRRGHKLAMSKKRRPKGLYVLLRGRQHTVVIKEEHDQVEREARPQERRLRARYAWERVPVEYESVPSGRLRIELPYSQHSRRDHWVDTPRSQVEGKVRDVIKELEHRAEAEEHAAFARQRRLEQEAAERARREAEKRAQWEAAMAKARSHALDGHRKTTFAEALDAWRAASEIREFCAALEQATVECPPEDRMDLLRSWITYGRSLADRLDPTRNPACLAEAGFDKDPSLDHLRPHLGDWSPNGPYKEHRPSRAEDRPPVIESYAPG